MCKVGHMFWEDRDSRELAACSHSGLFLCSYVWVRGQNMGAIKSPYFLILDPGSSVRLSRAPAWTL